VVPYVTLVRSIDVPNLADNSGLDLDLGRGCIIL
jgi:hypothetical protein